VGRIPINSHEGIRCKASPAKNGIGTVGDLMRYSSWASVNAENIEVAELVKKTHGGCSVLSTNSNVRGYTNLLFGHGIWEQKSLTDAPYLMEKANACQNILIEGENIYPDLPSYYRVTRVGRDGSVEVIWEKSK